MTDDDLLVTEMGLNLENEPLSYDYPVQPWRLRIVQIVCHLLSCENEKKVEKILILSQQL
jgi:hypothetical protein